MHKNYKGKNSSRNYSSSIKCYNKTPKNCNKLKEVIETQRVDYFLFNI